MHRTFVLLACLWSLAASYRVVRSPAYRSGSTSVSFPVVRDAPAFRVIGESSFLETNGPQVLLTLGLPALLALGALLAPAHLRARAALVAAVLVGLFSFLGAMTVGLYYAPAALLLLLGAVWPERDRTRLL